MSILVEESRDVGNKAQNNLLMTTISNDPQTLHSKISLMTRDLYQRLIDVFWSPWIVVLFNIEKPFLFISYLQIS